MKMRGIASSFCNIAKAAHMPMYARVSHHRPLTSVKGHPPMLNRNDVTEQIVFARVKQGLSWSQLARTIGKSKEWSTAALLGQHQMTKDQAIAVGDALSLSDGAVLLLQQVPYKGSLPTAVPTDPVVYRFYELVNVYGTTFKELIHEEFGDGIMSAIDFKMDLRREPHKDGDRVNINMSGKYLPYKMF